MSGGEGEGVSVPAFCLFLKDFGSSNMAGLEAMVASFRLSTSLEDLTKVCPVGVVESAES